MVLPPASVDLLRIARAAGGLGQEVVDIAGLLERLEDGTHVQIESLNSLGAGTMQILQVNASATETLGDVARSVDSAVDDLQGIGRRMKTLGTRGEEMMGWTRALADRSVSIQAMIDAVQENNDQIASIAAQVNMLAINAKIEAARAGEAGRGFSVVADAINELSQRTGRAAEDVSGNVGKLTAWVKELQREANGVVTSSEALVRDGEATGRELEQTLDTVAETRNRTALVVEDVAAANTALTGLQPRLERIRSSIHEGVDGVGKARSRVDALVGLVEQLVQDSATAAGGDDAPMIADVMDRAARIGAAFEAGVDSGRIALGDLFDRAYRPVRGSDPPQFLTRFTAFTDQTLPRIQEEALALDPRVVFCAAVDRRGYLPTHNRAFSKRQGKDPVWNAAHCRNRRIFDDRVGLRAGRNTEPFLLQVYRRDMGGGEFAMMKDLSAPIMVKGRHWGGLRLAYRF